MKARYPLIKKVFFFTLCSCISLAAANGQNVKIVKLWETGPILKVPECAKYCEKLDILFVSNVNGKPDEANGKGFISKINMDGTVNTLKWVEGLDAPKGMDIMEGKLYVSDLNKLVIIDIESGKVEQKMDVKEAVFLNDVAIDQNTKCVYISDSRAGKLIIYKYDNKQISTFYANEAIELVNGMYVRGETLFIGAKSFYQLSLVDHQIKLIVKDTETIDGLTPISKDLFIATNWAGRIFSLHMDGTLAVLENLKKQGYNTADFGIHTKKQYIYVPTFFNNSIIAYHYTIID